MTDSIDYDNLPDDLADLQDVDWDVVLPSAHLQRRHSTSLSSDYSCDDDPLDSDFITQLDRIEQSYTQPAASTAHILSGSSMGPSFTANILTVSTPHAQQPAASSSAQPVSSTFPIRLQRQWNQSNMSAAGGSSRFFPSVFVPFPMKANNENENENENDGSHLKPLKRRRSGSLTPKQEHFSSLNVKGKQKDVLNTLSGFEEELTCPICCDIFVATHSANPCGHSLCGDCGWKWTSKNRNCAVCRTALNRNLPLIPNIAMDNMVEKFVDTLALSGDQDWQPDGSKRKEWKDRQEEWRKESSARTRAMTAPARNLTVAYIDVTGTADNNDIIPIGWEEYEDGSDYQDSDEGGETAVVEQRQRRRRRRRHRRR